MFRDGAIMIGWGTFVIQLPIIRDMLRRCEADGHPCAAYLATRGFSVELNTNKEGELIKIKMRNWQDRAYSLVLELTGVDSARYTAAGFELVKHSIQNVFSDAMKPTDDELNLFEVLHGVDSFILADIGSYFYKQIKTLNSKFTKGEEASFLYTTSGGMT